MHFNAVESHSFHDGQFRLFPGAMVEGRPLLVPQRLAPLVEKHMQIRSWHLIVRRWLDAAAQAGS